MRYQYRALIARFPDYVDAMHPGKAVIAFQSRHSSLRMAGAALSAAIGRNSSAGYSVSVVVDDMRPGYQGCRSARDAKHASPAPGTTYSAVAARVDIAHAKALRSDAEWLGMDAYAYATQGQIRQANALRAAYRALEAREYVDAVARCTFQEARHEQG